MTPQGQGAESWPARRRDAQARWSLEVAGLARESTRPRQRGACCRMEPRFRCGHLRAKWHGFRDPFPCWSAARLSLCTKHGAREAMTGEESGGVGGPPPVATLAEDAGAQCHGTAPGCRSQVDEAASLGAPPEVPTQPASEQAPAAPHEAPRPRPHGKESPPEAPLEAPAEEQPRLQTMAQQAATPPEVPQQEAPPTPPKKPQQQQQSPPEASPSTCACACA